MKSVRASLLLTLALLGISSGASVVSHRYSIPLEYVSLPIDYRALAVASAKEEGVPALLFLSLLTQESGLDKDARHRNPNGTVDLGIAQINSAYLVDFAERYNYGEPIRPMVPESAIPVAARLLADLYRQLGSWEAALSAYNAGVDGYRKGKGREYAEAILRWTVRWRNYERL